jgi:CheY-like chemotaxis protein/HPt (histidine-containing phosphotransfer) domain-containing protein
LQRSALLVSEPGQDAARLEALVRQAGVTPMAWVQADDVASRLDDAKRAAGADTPSPVLVLDTLQPRPDIQTWVEALLRSHPDLRVLILTSAVGQHALAGLEQSTSAAAIQVLVMPLTPEQMAEALTQEAPSGQGGSDRPAVRRLAGARLLLVEDNTTNQQVAMELLDDEGALVALAENGAQAVERLRAGAEAFDAVLMDVQMPVMDGLTATRLIRGELGLQTLPVIAMTANAMSQDQEACAEAGMTAFVGKPLDLNLLVQTLLQCCPAIAARAAALAAALGGDGAVPSPVPDAGPEDDGGRSSEAAPPAGIADAAPSPSPSPDAGPADAAAEPEPDSVRRMRERLRNLQLDPEVLAEAKNQGFALREAMERVMGKALLLVRLCEGLQTQVRSLPEVLHQSREANDLRAARQALHSIKGLAASLGAEALAAEFRLAEQACAEGRWPDDDSLAALILRGAQAADELLGFARRLA